MAVGSRHRGGFTVVELLVVIGIIAVGVTQVIITGGVDLSSGSVVAITAMVAASLAQNPDYARAVYPSLTGLPVIVPVAPLMIELGVYLPLSIAAVAVTTLNVEPGG